MQKDKALLPFGNATTLSEYQYRRLEALFERVYIAAKSDKFAFSPRLIIEKDARTSPLVALDSIWKHLDEDEVFVLSVDTPFVTSEIIARLYAVASQSHAAAIVARTPQGLQPLCALYRRATSKAIQTMLNTNQHRLQVLLQEVQMEAVQFEEERVFANLNYPCDYDEAQEWLKRG